MEKLKELLDYMESIFEDEFHCKVQVIGIRQKNENIIALIDLIRKGKSERVQKQFSLNVLNFDFSLLTTDSFL